MATRSMDAWLGRLTAGRGRTAVAVVVAAAVGFSGAAVVAALAQPAVAVADGFGPAGDGLTRLVVNVAGDVTPAQFAALRGAPGVRSAQKLFTGDALVAGDGITPESLRSVVPGAQVTDSVPGQVAGTTVSDPYWSSYGWNLSNTGGNAYGQSATAGADVAAPTGWQAGDGAGITVAVVDTGMAINHMDLAGALWNNPAESCGSGDTDGDGLSGDCHGWNFYANNADVTNAGGDDSHGTSVAGVIAARAGNGQGSAGVAPGVTIMPLVIGSGSSVDLYLGAQAIRYAADHGADVINASWGGTGGSDILSQAIAYADSKGAIVVAAAGNDGLDRGTSMFYPASLNAENLVKVGASTATDTVSSFSAYGATTVDLFAPGSLVFSTWPDGGYRLIDGTSIAAPQVAAGYALYRAHDPAASAATLKQELLADAQRLPAFTGKSITGGRLSLTALGTGAGGVSYGFSGMVAQPGDVHPLVLASGSGPAGDYTVRLGLGMEYQSQVWALSQQPITVDGVTVNTDDEGTATFALGTRSGLGTLSVAPTTTLAEGRYVLTAQLYAGDTPVGRAYAAPLLVSTTAVPQPGTDPGTPVPGSDPGSTSPGSTDPGSSTPGSSDPGSTSPGSTSPGSTSPGSDPGSTSPGSDPGSSAPPADGGPTDPSAGGTPTPGSTDPVPPSGSSPAPGDISPVPGGVAPAPAGSSPAPSGSDPGSSAPADGSQPDLGGSKTYPQVGPFQLTSISPTRVSTAGGDVVTITGDAIPTGARVRIGTSTPVTVTSASSTSLRFTAPALVAGTYDVYVFALDGTSSVLTGGLTYVDPSGSSGGSQPSSGSTDPGTQPGSSDPGTQPGSSTPGTQPSTDPGTQPTVGGPTVVSGLHGERLVASARFAALGGSIWGLNCSSSCSGQPI